MSRHVLGGDFDENSPRPPVPGEENNHKTSQQYRYKPRSSNFVNYIPSSGIEPNAPLGFEPEGSCYGSSSPFYEGSRSPPSCLRWAQNLPSLLQDTEGVHLFTKYLEQEGKPHADALKFWFACEGLRKQQNKDKVQQLVKVIYKKFLHQTQLGIKEELRKEVTNRIREGRVDGRIFDAAQTEVERYISYTTYPNFLKSEIYLQCVQQLYQPPAQESSSGSSCSSGGRDVGLGCTSSMLPTLHEDTELSIINPADTALPLTRDMLMATQSRRALELRPKPEAYAGIYLQHSNSVLPRAYSSYNPVSRQDSELQSLSSDARTDSDAMSCTDSSVDGTLAYQKLSKHQLQKQYKAIKEKASINRDLSQHVIPRTQRRDQPHPVKPEEFAVILIQKLEQVKRELDAQEKLDKKLSEGEPESNEYQKNVEALADVIREKLQVDEQDCDQAILDQHVSRVWSDLTPSRSPGLISPRPKSPEGRRKLPYAIRGRCNRKEKDMFSTFSSDSGNVHDFVECSGHLPKSKSVPDYSDERYRVRELNRRSSSSKKTLTDLTDSGVSVVSDTVPVYPPQPPTKDSSWVMSWLLDNEKQVTSTTCHSHSESACSKHKTRSVQPPTAYRHGRKSERSGSLERHPQQPFVADPSMPPLPQPHTATQLEEACRRLMEDDSTRGKLPRQRFAASTKTSVAPPLPPDLSLSNQSTLRKSPRALPPPYPTSLQKKDEEFTTVVFSFCDEQFPYRTKIPSKPVTLKQFKEFLPKKGVYRYFFKTECEDVETKVIQEEITDDNEILPLWDGKIMAQVKPVD